MSNPGYVRPDRFPEWVNSQEDEALVGSAVAYFAGLTELNQRIVFGTRATCESFVRTQSLQHKQHQPVLTGSTTAEVPSDTLLEIQHQTDMMKRLLRLIVDINSAIPEPTASQQQINQKEFKQALISRYPVCCDPCYPTYLKCMVLGYFLPDKNVTATHIIGLTNHHCYPLLEMNYANDRYDERNGLLLYSDIASKYENQQITFMYCEADHNIRLQVLYDDVLSMQVGTLTKEVIRAAPTNSPLTYGDINGRHLLLPDMTVQPFRRAIVYMSKVAWANAMNSSRPHQCVTSLGLTEKSWVTKTESVTEVSDDFHNSPFFGTVFEDD